MVRGTEHPASWSPSRRSRRLTSVAVACGLAWCLAVGRAATGDQPPATVSRLADDAAAVTADYLELSRHRAGVAEAAALGRRFLREHASDPVVLDALAWGILTDGTLQRPDLALALEASAMAVRVTDGADGDALETHALALFRLGRRDEAAAMQRRAIALTADDPSTRLVLEENLRGYLDPRPPAGPTDDERIRTLEDAAFALIESGRAVSVADLLDRASTTPCTVPLAAPAEEPLTAEALYERVRPSVVILAALEPDQETGVLEVSLATGFVVHASGVVVTNFHVVDAPDSPVLVAMTADGSVHAVSGILAVSPLADVAICRLEGTHDLPALACVTSARPGARLHVLSHPDAAFWSFTEGILSRFFALREDGRAKTMFTTTADFAVGSSGGPVVDACGNVVGMVSSTLAIYAAEGPVRRGAARRRAPAALAPETEQPPGDFQMGLNMCVPAADILALVRAGP
jgi:serine protease Do